MEKKKLTAANGRPIADNQNSQTAGNVTRSLAYREACPF